MSVVYPACPDPDCDYVHLGQPVRVLDGRIQMLLVHTVRNSHMHRAIVTIEDDGTQHGRLLDPDEQFEGAA